MPRLEPWAEWAFQLVRYPLPLSLSILDMYIFPGQYHNSSPPCTPQPLSILIIGVVTHYFGPGALEADDLRPLMEKHGRQTGISTRACQVVKCLEIDYPSGAGRTPKQKNIENEKKNCKKTSKHQKYQKTRPVRGREPRGHYIAYNMLYSISCSILCLVLYDLYDVLYHMCT